MTSLPHPALQKRKKSIFRKVDEPFALIGAGEFPMFSRLAILRPTCVTVYLVLRQMAGATGFAWPSQARVAGLAGISRAEVRRALLGLREVGALVRVRGAGRRADRYALRRLDEGPLRDRSGPWLEEAKTRLYGTFQPPAAGIRTGAKGPLIHKNRGTRKRRGTDRTGDLFPYPPAVVQSPTDVDPDNGVRNRAPVLQEKGAVPAGPHPPAAPAEPSGPVRPPTAAGTRKEQPVPSGPSEESTGAAQRKTLRELASIALGRAGVRLGLLPDLVKTEKRCQIVLQAATEAISKGVTNPAGYIVRRVLGTPRASPRPIACRRTLSPTVWRGR